MTPENSAIAHPATCLDADQAIERLERMLGGKGQPIERLAYTPGDAAIASSLSKARIYQLIDEGKLEARKVGRRTLVLARSLHRLIEDGC